MRIAVIAPPWVPVPPPAYGGTEAVIDNLARGLQSQGHDVLLFTTGDSTCAVPTRWVFDTAAGTDGATPAAELCHVVNAYEAIREWGADVVHDHTLVGPLYGHGFGMSVVTTNHGPFESELRDVYGAMGDVVAIIAVSARQASTAGEIPVAAVIHHGLDVEGFPKGDGSGGYALFLGRMSPDKGVHVAARVARAAGVPLRIVAKMREPAEGAYFERFVRLLLGGDIEYVGEVGGQEKRELLAGATCLLNPLAWPEPFGMVMIEALACGTPVVVTNCGSAPELIDEGVTGFIRDTEEGLIDALRSVGSIDRQRCRKEAAERFSTARMVDDHVAVYRRTLQRRLQESGDASVTVPARTSSLAYTS